PAGTAVGEQAVVAVPVPAEAAVGDLEGQVLEDPQQRVVLGDETLLPLDPDTDLFLILLEKWAVHRVLPPGGEVARTRPVPNLGSFPGGRQAGEEPGERGEASENRQRAVHA